MSFRNTVVWNVSFMKYVVQKQYIFPQPSHLKCALFPHKCWIDKILKTRCSAPQLLIFLHRIRANEWMKGQCLSNEICLLKPSLYVSSHTVVAPPSAAEDADEQKEGQKDKQEEILLNVIRPDYERPAAPSPMEPLYSLTEDGKVRGSSQVSENILRDHWYQYDTATQTHLITHVIYIYISYTHIMKQLSDWGFLIRCNKLYSIWIE